eukprot:Skav203709  [mRNA]  locus=scaffold259:504853:510479:- [translate_table: standard]
MWARKNGWLVILEPNPGRYSREVAEIKRSNNGIYLQSEFAQQFLEAMSLANRQMLQEIPVDYQSYGSRSIDGEPRNVWEIVEFGLDREEYAVQAVAETFVQLQQQTTHPDTALKVEKCQAAGLKVLFCIGELLEEREAGKTDEAPKHPKLTSLAIGTGKVATPDQAEETQAAIRAYIKEAVSAEIRIQYGGSVTPDNCKELITKPNIDGFLVGAPDIFGH